MSHNDGINQLGLDIDWANEDEANKYIWILVMMTV